MKYIKIILLNLFFTSGIISADATQYHNEVLVGLVQSARKYDPNTIPQASKDFCSLVEKYSGKAIKEMNDQEINDAVNKFDPILKNKAYNELTVADKKLVIENFVTNFFNRENKDSLHKFIHTLIFVVMQGQTFDELKPIIEKHRKELEKLAMQKGSAITVLQKFKPTAEAIYRSIPESVKENIRSVAKTSQRVSLTNPIQPSVMQKAAAIKIALTNRLTSDQRSLLELALAAVQYRLDQQQPTSKL